ncbi:MAG TPA: DUF3368 domain-containing protein [Parapedobacter sp.]|uniref:DUF3368 domain-containing protein n=1 Tax=Parapedobacter sp. TaxID=1958893 RepID=UPI002B76F6F5|nr:DUF3368 domain-containing protein [Parapedobacter sp.]HWK57575.1 DUF3368 domain-containing protein [Parapedobacter sp.]
MSSESPTTNTVITDASCFIILDKIDGLPVLESLFSRVVTTPEIAAEYGKRLPFWVEVRAVEDRDLLYDYAERVDIGEASAIALASEVPFPLLIIDDMRGRKLADQLHLDYTGTLGVLVLARQRGIIDNLRPHFNRIRATNFRIPERLLNALEEIYDR